MPLAKDRLQEVLTTHRKHDGDSGSTEVQVALISERIRHLTEHFKQHKKDHQGRLGLLRLVGRRRRLLAYLRRKDFEAYTNLIASLGLRK